ncbi:MAG: cobalamin B12-binding domain-containing protein, partial [Acidobacteria bacterium]|nr:cobalamin B12-binding domain-containing protein [Acidobacteriota bacterium]
MRKKILGAALGTCVHVSGLYHFLKLAETAGYETELLGPAVSPQRLVEAICELKPDITAVSYRLTPGSAQNLFAELKELVQKNNLTSQRLIFGGTPPVAHEAEESGLFEKVFSGAEPPDKVKSFLYETGAIKQEEAFPGNLLDRIKQKYPYPLLRHHFGRPSLAETIEGAKKIASSAVLDVISLGPDQNAQEHFFHPEAMDKSQDGAGGVPVRKPQDLEAIYAASRCGNYPLMRCYSGTQELIKWAEMSVNTIHNAWGAIPLCWYSVMDGRSNRSLVEAIRENQKTMHWYAERGIPVEVNESHQWSLRDAHDSLAVCMAFLAAYNAKKMGVRHYVSQYMFNTPPGTSPRMDIAKMLAKNELIESIQDQTFTSYREVRAGIAHFSAHPDTAKGQLAASAVVSLALKPHILHVVGFSEGDHAVFPEEIIESCNIIHGVLQNCLSGFP